MTGAPSLHTSQKRETSAPFDLASANNGLSVDPSNGKIVLGNNLAAPGDPAQLLSFREILVNSFPIELRQGPIGTGGFGIIGASLDASIGSLFHCFVGASRNDPTGTIIYRATQNDPNCSGAIMQLECAGDVLSAVGQVAALGSNGGNPAYARGTIALISTNANQPDVLLKAFVKGAPGVRPGRVLFGTIDTLGTDKITYSFLMPVLANLDFPNTLAQTSSDLTINVPGAADGDSVSLGVPIASQVANTCYTAFVSAVDTVTVRFNNYSAGAVNPAAGNFKVAVIKLL